MRARRPTSAMPTPFLCCERLLPFHGGDVLCFEVKCFDVLMSVAGSGHAMVTSFDAMWWLVLCHVTWCNAMSWCWAVLLQYYPVLQSITPVLTCTTKYYKVLLQYYPVLQSTTLCYKVLLQYSVLQILLCILHYYPVLQSTTQVLLCTTKYYSNTTPYYKYYSVLLQYNPVLQRTTPVLLCTTPVLPCTTKYYSSTNLYYKVLLQ